VERALQAQKEGADYLGVGAIYPTTTKVVTVITEVSTLREICRVTHIPVCAIGGLNPTNCDVLAGSGIAGICVVSAIMKSEDPKGAAQALREKAEELRGAQ
jgi:thiamine-phosphate pyrophosphorylase